MVRHCESSALVEKYHDFVELILWVKIVSNCFKVHTINLPICPCISSVFSARYLYIYLVYYCLKRTIPVTVKKSSTEDRILVL